jgi:hypothetical protein
MSDTVPTTEEIVALAHQIRELAVKRKGDELRWNQEGTIDEEHVKRGQFGITGGFKSDYAQLRSGYDWIIDAFRQSVGPDPDGFDPLISTMETSEQGLANSQQVVSTVSMGTDGKVKQQLANGPTNADFMEYLLTVENARNEIVGWTGDAADNFRNNFLGRIPTVTANQVTMVRALRCAIDTTKLLHEQYRRDIKEVADKSIAVLSFNTGTCHGPSLEVTMGVAAGVLTIAAGIAALPAGGVAGGLTIGAGVAVTAQVLAGVEQEKEETPRVTVGGMTVDEILSSTYDGLTTVRKYLDEGERLICDNLDGNYSLLVGGYRSLFLAPRPDVIDLATKPASAYWNQFDD